jgi:hypothetical protein
MSKENAAMKTELTLIILERIKQLFCDAPSLVRTKNMPRMEGDTHGSDDMGNYRIELGGGGIMP